MPPPPEEFDAQTHVLALAGPLRYLDWSLGRALDGEVTWTKDRDEGRHACRAELQRSLTMLLEQDL